MSWSPGVGRRIEDRERTVLTCCTPDEAWAWVCTVAADALDGDSLSKKLLPRVVRHWLIVSAQ